MEFLKKKKCPSCHKKQAIQYIETNIIGTCKYCGAGFNNLFRKTKEKELLSKQNAVALLRKKLVSA
jgi:ribosomal protein L37AE/L43A